jgi:pectate lyase
VKAGVLALLLLGGALAGCERGGARTGGGRPAPPIVVEDVEALVGEVQGFGERATGGRGGEVYWVTTLADAGEGSLRAGAEGPAPRWIRFRAAGELRLAAPIAVGSNKTIDGRGARVVITGHGLTIDGSANVIVENLVFRDGVDDALQIINAAHDVWVDHSSFSRWGDGLIDITRASTDVTVSWCRFSEQDKVILLSASPEQERDAAIRVTLHHNHFARTVERHPRLRFGKVHAYNNYYEAWGSYGAAASMFGEILSQANVYEAGWDKDALLTQAGRDPAGGYARSVGDLGLNGARIHEREPGRVFDPGRYYGSAVVEPAGEALVRAVVRGAGWREVRVAP